MHLPDYSLHPAMSWLLHLAILCLALPPTKGKVVTVLVPDEEDLANNTQLFPIDLLTPLKRSLNFSDINLENNTHLVSLDEITPISIQPGRGRSGATERSSSDCGCGQARVFLILMGWG